MTFDNRTQRNFKSWLVNCFSEFDSVRLTNAIETRKTNRASTESSSIGLDLTNCRQLLSVADKLRHSTVNVAVEPCAGGECGSAVNFDNTMLQQEDGQDFPINPFRKQS